MFQGQLLAIQIAPAAAAAMQPMESIEAVAGKGLLGDRYEAARGAFSRGANDPDKQVTLIEREAIEAAAGDYKLEVAHATTRRNLLTTGVPLNHLVGREFFVGPVKLRGVKLCEPCGYLEKLTLPGIEDALRHRGGLRAEILTDGTLRIGDSIRPA